MSKLSALCGKYNSKIVLGEGENQIEINLKLMKTQELSEIFKSFNSRNSAIVKRISKLPPEEREAAIEKLTPEEREQVLGSNSESFNNMVDMIKKALRNSIPEATDEEVDEIALLYYDELSEALMGMIDKIFSRMSYSKKKKAGEVNQKTQ